MFKQGLIAIAVLLVFFNFRLAQYALQKDQVLDSASADEALHRRTSQIIEARKKGRTKEHLEQKEGLSNEQKEEHTAATEQEEQVPQPAAGKTKRQQTSETALQTVVSNPAGGEEAVTIAAMETVPNKQPSWRPTHEWLNSCAAELAANETLLRPYFTKRDGYGLGDCIKMCARCTLGRINRKDKNMALQYSSQACGTSRYVSGGNLDVVEEILEGYKTKHNPPEPPEDAIVLHLRVGDVIEKSQQSTEELLIKGGDPFHTEEFKTSIKSVFEYLEDIEESGVTNVIVVGGVFQKKHFEKSRVYEGCLERTLKKAGYNVRMQLDSGEADEDFYYMTRAKKFVVSSGGFSALIAKLVVRNGGKVVGRTFDDPEAVAKYERKMLRKHQQLLQKRKDKKA